jgi:hypothetical protein
MLLESIAIYCRAWAGAFSRRGRRIAPLGIRRLALLLVAFPLFLALQLLHWLGLLLDELLYPAYRSQRIDQPVFIIGVPRSGTTYLHREMARDGGLCTASTWELLLAPSLCQRAVGRFLAAVDRRLGAPLGRLLGRAGGEAGTALADVHPVALDAAEEDYLALLPAAGCFFAHLAFPESDSLARLGALGTLPAARRQRLLDHYHRLLQRQVYHCGGKQLLSKNAAFASWAPFLLARYPDALLVLCIREPVQALSSQLSSLEPARRLLAIDPGGQWLRERFELLYRDWYGQLAALADAAVERVVVVEQTQLRQDSERELARIFARLQRQPMRERSARALPRGPAAVHSPARHGLAESSDPVMAGHYLQLRQLADQP